MNYTDEWRQYQNGIDFKNKINLYKTVEENYRFFDGDQWHGVKSEGLPTPVFNVIKSVVRYKISTIMQNYVKLRYVCENYTDSDYKDLSKAAELLTKNAENLWERLKMDYYNEELLKDGAILGDGISYFYFDPSSKQIKLETIDNTNIYPSNPNLANIQEQEYIIISFRSTVEKVKNEAKKSGLSKELIKQIASDSETQYQAGNYSKIEQAETDKCIVLVKFWKDEKTGTVHFSKSTRDVVIIKDCDTGCTLYPIAMFNWETRKNCFHGVSDVTSLIPNQLYINKIAAMVMLSTMYNAFPKMVYDENLVDNPSNQIGVAIGVNGSDRPLSSIIDYIAPASVSGDAFNMFERTINLTKELMGANASSLGSVDPEKASGKSILAVMEQTNQPLESVKRRFYNYIEDVALIWADMWRAYLNSDLVVSYTDENGKAVNEKFKKGVMDKLILSARVDVGPASKWSEIATIESLDSMLNNKHIPFEWYVKLLPKNSCLPREQLSELIESTKQEEGERNNFDYDSMINDDMNNYIDKLHPQEKLDLVSNPDKIANALKNNLSA